jgi:hypothetical protein
MFELGLVVAFGDFPCFRPKGQSSHNLEPKKMIKPVHCPLILKKS